jgi:hypothetical protein
MIVQRMVTFDKRKLLYKIYFGDDQRRGVYGVFKLTLLQENGFDHVDFLRH